MIKAPKFVTLADRKCEMRLEDGRYYRDAGAWDLAYEIRGDKIFAKADYPEVKHLHGIELKPITFGQWKKGNGEYAPGMVKA